MLDFNRSHEADFQDFGRWIWQQSEQFSTHEQASQFTAAALFEEFIVRDEPQLALVRIFRLIRVDELPDDLLWSIPPDEQMALALTGTYGIEPDWCSRQLSKEHAIIPLNQAVIMDKIPMFHEMLMQHGLNLDHLRNGLFQSDQFRGQFFLPNTTNSPRMPDQANFVRPYNIQSEIGFGGYMCDRQCLYFLIAFSRVPISPDAALRFYIMQDYIGSTLNSQHHFTSIFDS